MTYEEAINTIEHGCIYRDKRGSEALEIAIIALKKQIPKKAISVYKGSYRCPTCEKYINITDDDLYVYGIEPPEYCDECGQALDWSDRKRQTSKKNEKNEKNEEEIEFGKEQQNEN